MDDVENLKKFDSFSTTTVSVHFVTMLSLDHDLTKMSYPLTCVLRSFALHALDAAIRQIEVSWLPHREISIETYQPLLESRQLIHDSDLIAQIIPPGASRNMSASQNSLRQHSLGL